MPLLERKRKFHLRKGVGEAEIERNEDNILLGHVSHHGGLSVHAICSMGGLGKTTIAQLVYNDKNVEKAFDLRAWVCVYDDFDIKRLTKVIVESIQGSLCDMQELDPLQPRLVDKLWDKLKQILRSGRRGSIVIVTTQLEKVTLRAATVSCHHLECLLDDDSWSLFEKKAFGMRTNEGNVILEMIGRQIVQRCRGVPLAIKTIGSILCFKTQESEWLRVKDNEICDLQDDAKRILALLNLSFEHLPPKMKQFFSFCTIYPKDYVMKKGKLIGLWIASGFIPFEGPLDLHDTSCEIFFELTRKSFFQKVKEDVNGTVTCKMHDLIHDVAKSIMGQECYIIEPNLHSLILSNKFTYHGIGNHSNPSHFISKQKYLKVLDFGYGFSNIAFEKLK
ncbi:disease resistance protein RGA2-like [Gossypium australe]|uniref:Disease resistance protein RGA2-like n=1 Tax=Gossypium australe TaxID=47621 RepID=A0A5B6W0M9_9ROSI|nr:disease resistance protein RGA2-like [Gossypium australe]